MFISDFAIQRPIVTITAMVALVAFGIAALLNLQTDEFPDIQQPIVGVTILYPGASPETVEREIVDPIEESFSTISGVDWSRTQASATDGLARRKPLLHPSLRLSRRRVCQERLQTAPLVVELAERRG